MYGLVSFHGLTNFRPECLSEFDFPLTVVLVRPPHGLHHSVEDVQENPTGEKIACSTPDLP